MRRIGTTPAQRGSSGATSCPDVIELDNGTYLVIGESVTAPINVEGLTSLGASVGPTESAVIVPRDCLRDAARQIAGEDAGGHDGRHAYEAYCVLAETLKPGERPAQEWDDIPVRIKGAWVNAATGVYIRSRLAAAEKLKAWASARQDELAGGAWDAVHEAISLIDPRDPRSLD